MIQPTIYFPAYLGFYAALLLSVACNAFLDIQYGSFSQEMIFWAFLYGWTLFVGWLQSRSTTPPGTAWQKIVLFVGIFLFLVVFLRLWGMPRAGIYLLAMLQASSNCVMVSRRQLNLGLLVSLTLVIFAASHYRADWTMLFYLIPYVIAVIFTLVAEQIHDRNNALKQMRLVHPSKQGQGAAIMAATFSILLIGLGLYFITPQVSWPYLEWRYGQVVPHNLGGNLEHQGSTGEAKNASQQTNSSDQQITSSATEENQDLFPGSRWPTPAEMRTAAKNRHMPDWQAEIIETTADLTESSQQILKPAIAYFIDLWEALKRWLKEHWLACILSLLVLLMLAILLAFIALIKEIPWVIWLLIQWEYLRFGVLARHANGARGARQYYIAMARMLSLHDLPRPLSANTREYLELIGRAQKDLSPLAAETTLLFEKARYGSNRIDNNSLIRMRALYREIYKILNDESL